MISYGVAAIGGTQRVVARVDGTVVAPDIDLLRAPTLNPFMNAGPAVWDSVYQAVANAAPVEPDRMLLPFDVADYVDFYASRTHAENLGKILRPGAAPLKPNWLHLPVGYHGRAGTVVVSGTPVTRPNGQLRAGEYGPTAKLDFEAEVGFVVGVPSDKPIPTGAFADHVFGAVLVNDWSARDVQGFEYVPLGPFLGKSFATSISAWVTPLRELSWFDPPEPEVEQLPHLRGGKGLDLGLEVSVNGEVLSRPSTRDLYWTPAQMLTHMTSNGAGARTGDLFASGTVSSPGNVGSMIEHTWNETFLADGDEIVISAAGMGEVRGRTAPALRLPG